MSLIRFLLVVVLTLSTSLSSAMDVGHMQVSDHDHAVVGSATEGQPVCCQDSTDRAQTCHALLALLPTLALSDTAPATGEDVFCASGVLLTGIEPSGPLDPPRVV